MPAASKAQFRLMHGVASGSIKPKGNLTKAVASEFVRGQKSKGLPERKRRANIRSKQY